METILTIQSNILLELQEFTSKDKTRPALQSIRFENDTAFATNSYTLLKRTVRYRGEPVNLDFAPVLKMLKHKMVYPVSILKDENENYFVRNFDDIVLPVQKIDSSLGLGQVSRVEPKITPDSFKIGIDTRLLPKGKFIFTFNPNDNEAGLAFTTMDASDYQGIIMPLRIK